MKEFNDTILYQKGKKVDYIQFKKLLAFPNLIHGYTLKTKSFDIRGNTDKVQPDAYQLLAEEFQVSKENIIRPYQKHTDVIQCIHTPTKEMCIFPEDLKGVDGLITNQKQVFFCLSYADCMSLLFFDPNKQVVANIHSGWRGTLQRIGEKAVENMIHTYQCQPEDIICCFGPSIHQCHFEVGEEVASLFYQEFKEMKEIQQMIQKRKKNQEEKYYIDTIEINKQMLQQKGLLDKNIIDSKVCTVCHQDKFHSYRAMGLNAGRNAAILGMK